MGRPASARSIALVAALSALAFAAPVAAAHAAAHAAATASAIAAAHAPPIARDVPPHDGWVTDLAGLLSASQEQELEALMESFQGGSGHDIALLTVPDLGGEPIDTFALDVAREWKLGSTETNDGALLVVSQGDRELRIEVGRGLEGTLTDAICGRIIRDVITPRFQAGDFAAGLREGVEALQRAAGGDYAALPAPAANPAQGAWGLIPFALFMLVLFAIFRRGRGRRGKRRGRGGPGGGTGGAAQDSVLPWLLLGNALGRSSHGDGFGSGSDGGGFGGFGGGGGFSGGGASGRW